MLWGEERRAKRKIVALLDSTLRWATVFNDDPYQTSKKAVGFCLSFLSWTHTYISLYFPNAASISRGKKTRVKWENAYTFQFTYAFEIHLKWCFNMFHLHIVLETLKMIENDFLFVPLQAQKKRNSIQKWNDFFMASTPWQNNICWSIYFSVDFVKALKTSESICEFTFHDFILFLFCSSVRVYAC